MRHHRRVVKVKYFVALLAVAALALSGCDSQSTGNPTIDARQLNDSAYEAVAAVQIANSANFSRVAAATTQDPKVKAFAEGVLTDRAQAQKLLKRLRNTGAPMDVKKASHQLDLSLSRMGITADDVPVSAPATDSGYIVAMRSNLKGTLKAAQAHLANGGGPGTSQLSLRLQDAATTELEQLKALKK